MIMMGLAPTGLSTGSSCYRFLGNPKDSRSDHEPQAPTCGTYPGAVQYAYNNDARLSRLVKCIDSHWTHRAAARTRLSRRVDSERSG